ncbi:hypothetical protein [Sphingomonas nostoxanthinifaciens]|uniref:hypothetical protein n=1 Tax=Sphingomonas nostoxanthinifaciens TaxID=2872652 RepID=UPI001CC1C2AD|nr:hypothetical protein [Sphingomonas nostoxanthinifaciens]UAK25872.1 hypothetical protein K8P63_07055 [Sphingomonas nostoxanthinifaciens]
MADDTSATYQASATLIETERAAAQAVLDKLTALQVDLGTIIAGLDYAPGYVSQPKQIAQGVLSNLSFAVATQLPQLIKTYSPTTSAA